MAADSAYEPPPGNDMVIRTLRAQAWGRAKGELYAVSSTFMRGCNSPEAFARFTELSEAFIATIESEGLCD